MMSPIWREAWLMSAICVTTLSTTSPPATARWLAVLARSLATWAESAEFSTVLLSSSMAEEVDCRLEAVCSVRLDRSWLPAAIWVLAVNMLSDDSRTDATISRSPSCMCFIDTIRCVISSWPRGWMSCVRSPWAMAWVMSSARRRGRVIDRMVSAIRGRKMKPGDKSKPHSRAIVCVTPSAALARRASASSVMLALSSLTWRSMVSASLRALSLPW